MVMKGALPYIYPVFDFSYFSGNSCLILRDDRFYISSILCTKDQYHMNMIWHNNKLIHTHIHIMVLQILYMLFCYFTKLIQLLWSSKNAFSLVCTYGNKIIVWIGIIIVRYSGRFTLIIRHKRSFILG